MPPVSRRSPAPGLVITVQQIIIGVAIGFVLQIVFDALAMGGQLLANTMGLSFAFNVDPLRGASAPVLGQFYTLIATLTFLALDGHIAIIHVLVDGFRDLPVGTTGLGTDGYWQIVLWGIPALPRRTDGRAAGTHGAAHRQPGLRRGQPGGAFAQPVRHRLPRDAVGGLLIVLAGLPSMQDAFIQLMRESMAFAGNLLGGD